MGKQVDDVDASSPATRLLDALGRGDLNALLLEFRPTTIVRTEDRSWSVQGEEEVLYWLEEAFERFPGLVFDSHARHVGYGQVIEEARVRDIGPVSPEGAPATVPVSDDGTELPDAPAPPAGALVRDRDFGRSEQEQLNMPVRLTVMHDDAYVHELIASYPRALLRSAMGLHVDPLDKAVSEIQSAFVAPAGSGFKTYELGSKRNIETEYAQAAPVPLARIPEPEPEPEPEYEDVYEDEPAPEPVAIAPDPSWTPPPYVPDDEEDDKPRRRALLLVPLVMVMVAAIAAGSWWIGRDDNAALAGDKPGKQGQSSGANKGDDKPTKKPSSNSPKPTPTKKPPVVINSDKPTITILKSDLAFDTGSAVLSDDAKAAIADIADAVRKAGLEGTIAVHGYTDNVGTAKSGMELSRLRAQAVAQYLRSALGNYSINISAFWHGENDPVASNDTEEGRKQNRRVTIILPKPPES